MFGLFTGQQDFAMLWMTWEFVLCVTSESSGWAFPGCFVFVVSFFLNMYFL